MADSPSQLRRQSSSPRNHLKKQKELRYVKALQKGGMGLSTPLHFDVIAQLVNILTRITIYELLRLFKYTRDALREALADAEIFMTRILAICGKKDSNHCHHTSKQFPCITFTPEDMQVKQKHDRPLYYIGYIRSSEVSCIQVDPGSALSIM